MRLLVTYCETAITLRAREKPFLQLASKRTKTLKWRKKGVAVTRCSGQPRRLTFRLVWSKKKKAALIWSIVHPRDVHLGGQFFEP